MRIVFINLHTNTFVLQSLRYLITKQRAIDKHYYIIKWLLDNDVDVCNLITLNGTTIPGEFLKRITNHLPLRIIEANYVLNKSKLPAEKIHNLYSSNDINDEDVVILYGHFPETQFDIESNTRGVKVVDHIHFYGDKLTANLVNKVKPICYISEIDLHKYCSIFRENYRWFNGDFICRKFAYQERFKPVVPFEDRKNKAVAMGTLTRCNVSDFVEHYGNNIYQPLRKMIYDNEQFLKGQVDSFISNFQEVPRKMIKANDLLAVKLWKKCYNFFFNGKQKKYFSFDMVEKYNEYKMFICPEDAIGQYGIGVIEGMACGCAMIGWNYGVYEDIGLKNGVSYISYDGTVTDLKKKIEYYQRPENEDELRAIASTGCRFVRDNFSQEEAAKEFYEDLLRIHSKYK